MVTMPTTIIASNLAQGIAEVKAKTFRLYTDVFCLQTDFSDVAVKESSKHLYR